MVTRYLSGDKSAFKNTFLINQRTFNGNGILSSNNTRIKIKSTRSAEEVCFRT